MAGKSTGPHVAGEAVAAWRADFAGALEKSAVGEKRDAGAAEELEASLREVARRVHETYGSPGLGNLQDPTDELVYIVLSRKTADRAYRTSFEALKARGRWEEVARLAPSEVEAIIFGGGLERKKSAAILEGLRILTARFGRPDLSRAGDLDDGALFDLLISLPEVGPKSALCIMLYSFHRAVFPVDAHVGRVLARTRIFELIGLDLMAMDHKQRQRALRDCVPPDLRYGLHVNLVVHGRLVCRAIRPDCTACVIRQACSYPEAGDRMAETQEER